MIFVKLTKTSKGAHQKLELWRSTLGKDFRITRSTAEYDCKLSQHKKRDVEVRFNKIMVTKCKQFRLLGSLFHENKMIEKKVTHDQNWMTDAEKCYRCVT